MALELNLVTPGSSSRAAFNAIWRSMGVLWAPRCRIASIWSEVVSFSIESLLLSAIFEYELKENKEGCVGKMEGGHVLNQGIQRHNLG